MIASLKRARILVALERSDRTAVFEAARALLRMRVRLWMRPGWALENSRSTTTPFTSEDLPEAVRLATAMNRVVRHSPVKFTCLVRALALREVLENHGIRGAEVRLGVRRAETGIAAHAWVACAGHVLGDRPAEVRTYRFLGKSEMGNR